MKNIKHIFALLILVSITLLISRFRLVSNSPVLKIFPIALLVLFVGSLLVRKIIWARPYFTSRFNIFTTKFTSQKEFDIPKGLMFEKVKEVVESSGFSIVSSDEATSSIFATSAFSWKSWGENLYIDFREEKEKTIMSFCSVTVFQVYSWGKNEQNFNRLINDFEEALTI